MPGRFGLLALHITALICDLSEVSEVFFSVLVIFHREQSTMSEFV